MSYVVMLSFEIWRTVTFFSTFLGLTFCGMYFQISGNNGEKTWGCTRHSCGFGLWLFLDLSVYLFDICLLGMKIKSDCASNLPFYISINDCLVTNTI